jgi:hypothetical protein
LLGGDGKTRHVALILRGGIGGRCLSAGIPSALARDLAWYLARDFVRELVRDLEWQ